MRRVSATSALLATTVLSTCVLATGLTAAPARAQDGDSRLSAIERQISQLQAELRAVKRQEAARDAAAARAAEQARQAAAQAARVNVNPIPQIPPGYALVPAGPGSAPGSVMLVREEEEPKLPPGTFRLGGVTVTLGGFIETAGIFRTRNEVADIASNFNTGIPLPNSQLYHENEMRFSARQTRVSAEAKADPDPVTHLNALVEVDFLGAAPTSNSVESSSYVPRMRHLYAQYDRSDWGLHFLAGQTWSLLTMTKKGITGFNGDYNIPLQIDAQYIPGFTWARDPQFRVAKDFLNKQLWFAVSLESPQINYYTGPNGLAPKSVGTINATNPGGSNLNSAANYSTDVAPDVQAKVAFDQPFGHFEAYGVLRFLHDRVSDLGTGSSSTVLGGGGGGGALLHVVPKLIDVQGSFLAGMGIGRYGSAQLPDAVVGANGAPKPLPEVEALAGIVGHPTPDVDLYTYFGLEEIGRRYFAAAGKGYGYGSPLYPNTSCDIELGPSASCIGNTSGIWQITPGVWWKFLHSKEYGSMQVGAQYSYTHRTVFQGVGPTPKTDDNMFFLSFRYYPFADTAPTAPPRY